ncbi:MAG: hypothetical protein Tsb0020_31870 [Haliangiales bacterium]
MPVQPTPVIGQYEIHALLGAGGSAEVWRGSITLPTGLEQQCALKRLKGELATRPLYQHRLKRELEIGLAVTRDHPNLVTTQTCEVIAGRPTIVMELVVGAALSTIDARLDFDMVRYLATEVLAALAHLADKGVVHRDLSPANILIDHQGAVRVGDFGMATWAEGDSWHGDVVGTEPYQAPEARAGGRYGCEADLYALGRILWELLTDDIDSSSLPRETPRDLRDVVNGLLAPQPRERWTASRALGRLARGDHAFVAAELGRMARGEVLTTTKGAPAPDTRRRVPAPDRDGASARYRMAARLGWLAAAAMTFVLGSVVGVNYLAPERRHVQDAPIAVSSAQKSSDVIAGTPPSSVAMQSSMEPQNSTTAATATKVPRMQAADRAMADSAQSTDSLIHKQHQLRPNHDNLSGASVVRAENRLEQAEGAPNADLKRSSKAAAEQSVRQFGDQLVNVISDPEFLTLIEDPIRFGQVAFVLADASQTQIRLDVTAIRTEAPADIMVVDRMQNCALASYTRDSSPAVLTLSRRTPERECRVRFIVGFRSGQGTTIKRTNGEDIVL